MPGVRGIAWLRITGSEWRQPVAVEFVATLRGRRVYEFAEKDAFPAERQFSQESFPECRGFVSCKQQYHDLECPELSTDSRMARPPCLPSHLHPA